MMEYSRNELMDMAVTFSRFAERHDDRLRELAARADSWEGLTESEMDEYTRRLERQAYLFQRQRSLLGLDTPIDFLLP